MTTRKRRRRFKTSSGRGLARWAPKWCLSLSLASLLLVLILNSICLELTPSCCFPIRGALAQAASNSTRNPIESQAAIATSTTSPKPKTQASPPRAQQANKQHEGRKRTRVKTKSEAQNGPSQRQANRNGPNLWRPTKTFRQQQAENSDLLLQQSQPVESTGGLQVSITPRVSLVRVPVESNAILKCLVSAQANNFTRPFKIRWSRFMYDENVYEQIESSPGFDEDEAGSQPLVTLAPTGESSTSSTRRQLRTRRRKRDDEPGQATSTTTTNSSQAAQEELEGLAAVPNRQQELRNFLARSRQETNVISSLLIEATLSISPVKANDNASYFCTATDGTAGSEQNQARIDLLALSRPVVRLERVQPARDSKSALVHWSIVSDGNTPIKRTILMVRNDSQVVALGGRHRPAEVLPGEHPSSVVLDGDRQAWQRIEIQGDGGGESAYAANPYEAQQAGEESAVRADVDVTSIGGSFGAEQGPAGWPPAPRPNKNKRAFNLSSLLPGVTYQLRLAAANDMGQSNWSQLAATMPNEIPAQISDIVVLSTTNDSITIGWRRPSFDGAKTIRYEMQLFDLNRTLTLDANTNTNSSGALRTNFMFHFVNLNPGTDYHFHIRACSRAGCSAYSSPKLLASTLDGESDEPLDVELVCQSSSLSPGNLSVSWLPPLNARGRLSNYSVTIESSARFRNQSGQWTSDEWRTSMDTADNHTLGLEAGNLLMPNTNYTARVCANNRSRRCGKPSQLTARSQCSTPAELPRELPANIRLALKQMKLTDVHQDRQQVETLVLELPFISMRNGSIDCIQIVLIRLPKSFESSRRALSDFLPDDPAEIRTQEFLEIVELEQQAQSNETTNGGDARRSSEMALAYLADELDQVNQSGSAEEIAQGAKQIPLGDGIQSSCAAVLGAARPARNPQNESALDQAPKRRKSIQALDGPLIAQTHYTGFLRLVQVRPARPRKWGSAGEDSIRLARRELADGVELLTSYSDYFSPVRTGDHVPQIPISALSSTSELGGPDGERAELQGNSSFCASKLVQQAQERLGLGPGPCLAFAKFAETTRRGVVRLYHSASGYLGEGGRFESLARLMSRDSQQAQPDPMQPLELGLVICVSTLLLLFVVYLFTLPSKLRRRRKLRIKRRLMQHEQAAAEQQASDESAGFVQQQMVAGQQNLEALTTSLGYQQVAAEQQVVEESPQVNQGGTLRRHHQECPVHSSPRSLQVEVHHQHNIPNGPCGNAAGQQDDSNDYEEDEQETERGQFAGIHRDRRQSVHVCQQSVIEPEPQMDSSEAYQPNVGHHHHPHHAHHHQHHAHHHPRHAQQAHHHSSAYQLDQAPVEYGGEPMRERSAHMLEYERNCRTMARRQLANGQNGGQQVPAYFQATSNNNNNNTYAVQQQQLAYNNGVQQAPRQHHTMTMQHNTVMSLAKKINKSVPLSLFGPVLESRLRSGWLREEYEQLPRSAQLGAQQPPASANEDGRHIRLRPQLIVSRDDSISALISGNDKYDGSLIRLPAPSSGGERPHSSVMIERQFICAKSPVDPDSVWDFWRLIYEREVNTLVMLTPNEDVHTGDIRCAQYWPTCDNEETTILSPCNEFVQQSGILPAKFKIRQETLSGSTDEFVVRRLTLLVMATKPSENEHTSQGGATTTPTTTNDDNTSRLAANGPANEQQSGANESGALANGGQPGEGRKASGAGESPGEQQAPPPPAQQPENNAQDEEEDEERLVIVERNLLHFQFLHWNASSSSNQTKLIKFIELVNERHAQSIQQQASPGTDWSQMGPQNPILVHCANGIGRSGVFTAMSLVIDELSFKLAIGSSILTSRANQHHQQQQMAAKLNLFQLVARLRTQRDMLLSPYRFYELLYQLTARCIPAHPNHGQLHNHAHQNHNHGHNHHHQHQHNHGLQNPQIERFG